MQAEEDCTWHSSAVQGTPYFLANLQSMRCIWYWIIHYSAAFTSCWKCLGEKAAENVLGSSLHIQLIVKTKKQKAIQLYYGYAHFLFFSYPSLFTLLVTAPSCWKPLPVRFSSLLSSEFCFPPWSLVLIHVSLFLSAHPYVSSISGRSISIREDKAQVLAPPFWSLTNILWGIMAQRSVP